MAGKEIVPVTHRYEVTVTIPLEKLAKADTRQLCAALTESLQNMMLFGAEMVEEYRRSGRILNLLSERLNEADFKKTATKLTSRSWDTVQRYMAFDENYDEYAKFCKERNTPLSLTGCMWFSRQAEGKEGDYQVDPETIAPRQPDGFADRLVKNEKPPIAQVEADPMRERDRRKMVKPLKDKPLVPPHLQNAQQLKAKFNEVVGLLRNCKTTIAKMSTLQGGERINLAVANDPIDMAIKHLQSAQFENICPWCRGGNKQRQCKPCEGLGWATKQLLGQYANQKGQSRK